MNLLNEILDIQQKQLIDIIDALKHEGCTDVHPVDNYSKLVFKHASKPYQVSFLGGTIHVCSADRYVREKKPSQKAPLSTLSPKANVEKIMQLVAAYEA